MLLRPPPPPLPPISEAVQVGNVLALCVKAECMFTLGGLWKPCPLENVGRSLAHRNLLIA